MKTKDFLTPFLIGLLTYFIIPIIAGFIVYLGPKSYNPLKELIRNIVKIEKDIVTSNPGFLSVITSFITSIITFIIIFILMNALRRCHFKHSLRNACYMRRAMRMRVGIMNRYSREENKLIDNYIQSPIEYAKEIVKGNQVPKFDPDASYQDILYDDKIKFILVITAENPNMFLDPTIGFYMSNCYAASLIRHVNDFIKRSDSNNNGVFQLSVQNRDNDELNSEINKNIDNVINSLKDNGELTDFEFVRIFIYDKKQRENYDNAVFPSMKASQDLFRTLSFYIQKEKLTDNHNKRNIKKRICTIHQKLKGLTEMRLSNNAKKKKNDSQWEQLVSINRKLWGLFDRTCNRNPRARDARNKRIDNVIPEFIFVFYKNAIGIHTYLGGEYCQLRVEKETEAANNIIELIKILANHIQRDQDKCQLSLGEDRNDVNAYINWGWVTKN